MSKYEINKLKDWSAEALCTHTRTMLRLWEKWFDRICMGEKIARHILSTRRNWFLILLLQPTASRRWYCLTSPWLEDCLFLLIVMAQLAADAFVLAHSVLEDRVFSFSYRWKGSLRTMMLCRFIYLSSTYFRCDTTWRSTFWHFRRETSRCCQWNIV